MAEFAVGDEIHHKGEDGRFVVKEVRKDGDLTCWGGLGGADGIRKTTGYASWRTFKPANCRHVKSKRKLRVDG